MRVSPLKHPLAVLRTTIGLGQSDLANKLGCSWRTIQSIELGTLKLSTKLANKICDQTGIHINWLMTGDPNAPMIDERGLPWRKEKYFDAQGRKLLPGTRMGTHYATDLLDRGLVHVCAAVAAAAGSKNIRAYIWRLVNGIDKAVDDLKSYPGLLQEFMQIMVDHAKDTQAGRKAVLGEAEKRVREWKEARPGKKGGRVKAKG